MSHRFTFCRVTNFRPFVVLCIHFNFIFEGFDHNFVYGVAILLHYCQHASVDATPCRADDGVFHKICLLSMIHVVCLQCMPTNYFYANQRAPEQNSNFIYLRKIKLDQILRNKVFKFLSKSMFFVRIHCLTRPRRAYAFSFNICVLMCMQCYILNLTLVAVVLHLNKKRTLKY